MYFTECLCLCLCMCLFSLQSLVDDAPVEIRTKLSTSPVLFWTYTCSRKLSFHDAFIFIPRSCVLRLSDLLFMILCLFIRMRVSSWSISIVLSRTSRVWAKMLASCIFLIEFLPCEKRWRSHGFSAGLSVDRRVLSFDAAISYTGCSMELIVCGREWSAIKQFLLPTWRGPFCFKRGKRLNGGRWDDSAPCPLSFPVRERGEGMQRSHRTQISHRKDVPKKEWHCLCECISYAQLKRHSCLLA